MHHRQCLLVRDVDASYFLFLLNRFTLLSLSCKDLFNKQNGHDSPELSLMRRCALESLSKTTVKEMFEM